MVLELAYRYRDWDKECSIFWLPCTSHEMVEQTYLNIAQTLGFHDVKPAEVKEQIKTYLSSETAGKWLLIFDNADDVDMWLPAHGAGPALEDFLPQSEQGRILFTTRSRKLAVELTSSNIITIPDEDKEVASKILQKSLINKDLLKDHVTADALLRQLAFLPLAIIQASAYINKNGLSLSTYLDLLQEKEPEVVDLLSEDFKDAGRYNDVQNPVITTWLISFKQIQHQDQLAADCLSFMACINPRNIPQSLLPLTASRKRGIDALGLLDAYSFTNSQDEHINMHRLVHIAIRNWLRKNGLFSHWIKRVADQMHKVFPDHHYTNRGLWRQYLPHALALVHENEFIVLWEQYNGLMGRIGACVTSDGSYHEAVILYRELMKLNLEKNGPEHPDTLISMANLASTYRNQGRWNEAETLQVQVMGIFKTVLGLEHPDTLISMANLASIYSKKGRWNEAEKLQVQVVEIFMIMLGPEHPDTLISMANLASIYSKTGRWNEAEKLQVQVIETRKIKLGLEHPSTLNSMANLALTYQNQGRWNEAEKIGVQVVEIFKTVLGAEHPDTLTSMANLASIYSKTGRWNEAEKLQVQVMEIFKIVLGPENPDTLISMANMASTYQNQGRWNEAEKLQVQVVEIFKTVLGPEHPDTLTSMNNLAFTFGIPRQAS